MKYKILKLTLFSVLIYTTGFSQISKEKSSKVNAKLKQNSVARNSDHIGTWKLVSQKITHENGQIEVLDSSSIF